MTQSQATGTSMFQRNGSGGGTSSSRGVGLSDRQLLELAADTEESVQWDEILSRPVDGGQSGRAWWTFIEQTGSFAVYSKQEAQRFAVLAVGVLPCSVPEVARLLHASDGETILINMEGLYGDEFKDGAFMHRVQLNKRSKSSPSSQLHDHPELVSLDVKSVVFTRPRWHHHDERWSFVEAAYSRQGGTSFEKLTTTLPPDDVAAVTSRRPSSSSSLSSHHHHPPRDSNHTSRSQPFHNVTTAFSAQPEDQPESGDSHVTVKHTRVFFYGEFVSPARLSGFMPSFTRRGASSSSAKTIKQRLLTLARSCDRLLMLARRRRLGAQVLVDRKRLAFVAAPSQRCLCCDKSIVLLAIKQCRICGDSVCSDCSRKHERETKLRGSHRMLLEDVRVCRHCLARVDRSDFSELNDTSLLGPTVHPNAPNEPRASIVLKELLRHELRSATSPSRHASVLNVIKCVLSQDNASMPVPMLSPTQSTTSTDDQVWLTNGKDVFHEADFVDALDSMKLNHVSYADAELATASGRSYALQSSHPDQQQHMAFPMPTNEHERLRAMEDLRIHELVNNSDELNIICELAAKEMGTFASMVTIVNPEKQQVVAANIADLQNATFPREEAFCAHTIMDDRPTLIPHPEADLRFNQCGPVKDLGIRFYCGFPLKTEDNTVIGALCCIEKSSREMTETQYNAMQKLAETASRVIQVQGKHKGRQRTASTLSTASK